MARRSNPAARRIGDRYRLTTRIAIGGSAEVWRAHDELLDRSVAVKLLHPHLLPDDRSRRRLAAEARAAAALSHPAVVEVYDVDPDGDAPALVMQLIDGESLAARLEGAGRLEPREAARLVAAVADALYLAHRRGIVHRDVKPSNILLDQSDEPHLVDFGIAHSLDAATEQLTMIGTVVGTLRYMAPEQLIGARVGPRTDLWGLGAVLFEALSGAPPFTAQSPVGLVDEQKAGPPAVADIDPALAAVIAACLSVDAEDRPPHAGALAAALRAWLAGDPAPALAMAPGAIVDRAVDTAAITQPMPLMRPLPEPADARLQPARSRVRPLALVAAAGGALVIGLSALALIDPGRSPPAVADVSPSPTPSASPSPVWMAELADAYAEACGQPLDPAVIAGMSEEDATDAVEELIKDCEDAGEGKRGHGKGRGNGGD